MAKLIILSVIIASFTVPVWLSGAPQGRQGLRRMQRIMVVLIVVWAFMCLHWYPSLVFIE